MLLVALGTALAGRFLDKLRPTFAVLAGSELLLAIILPLQIYLARIVGRYSTLFPGQLIDPLSMILLSAAVLAPGCLLLGAQFAWGCRLFGGDEQSESTANIAAVYVLEAVGAIVGGILFHFWLADNLQTVRIVLVVALLNAVTALIVSSHLRRDWPRRLCQGIGIILAVLSLVAAVTVWASRLEAVTTARRWPGFELVASQHTRYGNVAVTRLDHQLNVFHDGLLMFTSQDRLATEELSHLVMLQHPDPQAVLIMGGGLAGVIGEVLKHQPERVDYVELDQQAVGVIAPQLPERLRAPLRDKRVHIIYADALAYLRATDTRYDVIISNVGDPMTAVLNRFHTRQAFEQAAAHLKSPGIYCTSLSYPQTHLSGPRRMLHASVYGALKKTFPQALALPDGRIYYLAATERNILTTDAQLLTQRLDARDIQTDYITPYFLQTLMVPFQREYLEDSLAQVSAPVNEDFRPITYHYFLRLWLQQFLPGSIQIKPTPTHVLFAVFGGLSICFLVTFAAWRRRSQRSRQRAVAAAIAVTGVIEMSMQLVIIFSFQVIAGSLFYQIGILMTLFMVGIAVGGHSARRLATNPRAGAILLTATLVGLAAASVLMPSILGWLATHRHLASVVLGACAAIFGTLGGLGYPAAVEVCTAEGSHARAGASLYASDLSGAALGALVVSTVIIPVAGLSYTCLMLAALSLGGFALSTVGFAIPKR
jgi:spermidine synthase